MADAGALVEASDRNLRETWRTIGLAGDGITFHEDDHLLLMSSGEQAAFFNPGFIKQPGLAPEEVVQRSAAFFGPLGVPFMLWVLDGATGSDGLVAKAPDLGLTVNDGPPAMVMAPITTTDSPVAVGPVVTDADLAAAVELAAAGFGMPLEMCRRIITRRLVEHPDVHIVVARADGEPVSTATLVVTGEVAGVYTVATPEAHRRHGYGEAATAAVVEEGARRGCRVASLQASAMGAPVYERMGFRSVAGYHHLVGSPPDRDGPDRP